jgi:iron transport multicopper oxidase
MINLLFTVCNAADVIYNWKVGYVKVNPDGQMERRAIGVNGEWPIPGIEANIGDNLIINVENNLDFPTSVHSHGLFHNKTGYMDGSPGITECGIAPGSKFTYKFPIEQTGTYWAHSHSKGQYVDGFQTSLILRSPNEKELQNYDEEYTLSFTDWYHEEHPVLLKNFLSIYNPQGAEPIPNSALINHGQKTELVFIPGKVYRLRLIAMSAIGRFNFYIDDHKFKVIEVDGELVEPYETDVISIAAAQRYSVLVNAKENAIHNYFLHAKLDQEMLDSPSPSPNATASIIYDQNAPFFLDPSKSDYPSDYRLFDDTKLKPLKIEQVSPPDVTYVYDVDFLQYEDAFNHGTFNRTVFEFPLVPSIFSAMTMGEKSMNPLIYGPRTLPVVLNHLDMVEIIINNRGA